MHHAITADRLAAINKGIIDRNKVFYWQTDRPLSPEETGTIWADRHSYFTDDEIIAAVNKALKDDTIAALEPLDPEAQTSLGNINSVRSARLASGKEVIIRCHPRGIRNGYFYAEALAARKALKAGLPAYRTLVIHEAANDNDFAFHVCEKLPGTALQHWLQKRPQDEAKLLSDVGKSLARLHQIKVEGFGPFDNEKAKHYQLIGLHPTFTKAVRAGLDFNLRALQEHDVITKSQASAIDQLFVEGNPLLICDTPVLIHNDFADWNMLTDGEHITAMLDWDECVGGDPMMDIACWSTFFDPSRLDGMLKGYWTMAKKTADFEEKFELLRLRYTISKMTLRVRRYIWEPTDAIKQRINIGKTHLADSMAYFGIE